MGMKKILNYIDGSYCEPFTQDWLDNYNPSKGAVYSKIASSSSIDVDKAYQAAKKAFPSWSNTTIDERSAILLKIANLIDDNLDMLAEAESLDNGKPLSLAKTVDIPRASSNFRFFAHAITQFASEAHESVGLEYHELYFKTSYWSCRMYIPLEFTIVLIYLENCSGLSRREYCCCKTK